MDKTYTCEFCNKDSVRTLRNGIFICSHCGEFSKPKNNGVTK